MERPDLPDDAHAASVFEALGDPTRRQVLRLVATGSASTATQLSGMFPVTRQAVAKHLQVLLDAGLVTSQRRGRETVFTVVAGAFDPVRRWLDDLDPPAEGWEGEAAALRRHLEEQRKRRGLDPSRPGQLPAAAAARRVPPRA